MFNLGHVEVSNYATHYYGSLCPFQLPVLEGVQRDLAMLGVMGAALMGFRRQGALAH